MSNTSLKTLSKLVLSELREQVLLYYPRLLDEPVRFPELLLDTTEIALAIASTADSLSANVFLSERSASETHHRSSQISCYKSMTDNHLSQKQQAMVF